MFSIGVFGAVDCTYYVTPRPLDSDFESLYYSGYKKHHGVKLSVIVCIFSGRVLHVAGGPASVPDNILFEAHQEDMLTEGARLMGDKAYEGIDSIVSPHKETVMNMWRLRAKCNVPGAATELAYLQAFNTHLAKYRIRVEQGIRMLKAWSAARGVPSS